MNPIPPVDDIVGPIIHQLALALTNNIPSIGRMYEEPPDGAPEPNSVIFPLNRFKFEDSDAIGKKYIRLTFGIRYIIRRTNLQDNLQEAYKYFSAITRVLSSWPIQSLTDPNTGVSYAIEVCPKEGAVTQLVSAGQTFFCLIINTEVLTEINLITG